MTPTEELRHMLDERKVSWHEMSPSKTKWHSDVLCGVVAASELYGRLVLDTGYKHVTPTQAIAATLGTGTCNNVSEYPRMFFCCSECGCAHKRSRAYVDMPRFCPDCGRKVAK